MLVFGLKERKVLENCTLTSPLGLLREISALGKLRTSMSKISVNLVLQWFVSVQQMRYATSKYNGIDSENKNCKFALPNSKWPDFISLEIDLYRDWLGADSREIFKKCTMEHRIISREKLSWQLPSAEHAEEFFSVFCSLACL